jgi:ABC-type multidrug transport system ATPase subunit
MSIVGLQQVCKKFGPVFAVDKASFEVNGGELFGLLGPNGVGKTTFIRLVWTSSR